MVTDLVGRTGADRTCPSIYRGCPSWSRTAAGRNEGTVGLRCANPCARLEDPPANGPRTVLILSGAPATTKDLDSRAGLNTHTAATWDQARDACTSHNGAPDLLVNSFPANSRRSNRAQCLNAKISKCRGIYVCARLRSPL